MSGRPLITWAIEIALKSELFSEVVVSTDDREIAEIARGAGASVPFERPADLSNDYASTAAVVAHAISAMQARGFSGSLACCIYPASIFISAADLTASRRLLESSNRDFAVALVRYQHPIQRALHVDADQTVTALDPVSIDQRTQDLQPRWHDAGQFYWGRVAACLAQTPVLPNSMAYEINANDVQDIDEEVDWRRAQVIHALLLEKAGSDPESTDW